MCEGVIFAKNLLHLDLTMKHVFTKLFTRVTHNIGNLTQILFHFICIAYKFEIHLNIAIYFFLFS